MLQSGSFADDPERRRPNRIDSIPQLKFKNILIRYRSVIEAVSLHGELMPVIAAKSPQRSSTLGGPSTLRQAQIRTPVQRRSDMAPTERACSESEAAVSSLASAAR